MEQVKTIESPLVADALSHLRDKSLDTPAFRQYADRISYHLLAEAFFPSNMVKKAINTPVGSTIAPFITGDFVFVTILRAGLAMLNAAIELCPSMPVGFIGLKREEQTAVAHEYYCNLPIITSGSTVILADPMLATGGSMVHALKKIIQFHPKEIRVVTVICAPEGINAVNKEFSEIPIITAAVDSHLNDKKYIVPGLGDFGDRYFGTLG